MYIITGNYNRKLLLHLLLLLLESFRTVLYIQKNIRYAINNKPTVMECNVWMYEWNLLNFENVLKYVS